MEKYGANVNAVLKQDGSVLVLAVSILYIYNTHRLLLSPFIPLPPTRYY